VKKNIFASSKEQNDIEKALEEWKYINECELVDYETCEICGQTGLRYLFTIRNTFVNHILKIGSECIKRFSAEDTKSIRVYDIYGNRVFDERLIIRLINKDVKELTKDAKQLSVLDVLNDLYEKTNDKYVSHLFDVYSNDGELTPLQMIWLHDAFRRNQIIVNPNDFNVNISNNFNMDQVYTMSSDSLNILRKYLTRDQLRRLEFRLENFKDINR
jgi:hypothetical protein